MEMQLNILRAGKMGYPEALALQERTLLLRQERKIPDTLILVEHPDVLTLGRRGDYANILLSRDILEKQGVAVHEVNRGGDVTYHGPGQIVGYPVMDLNLMGNDIKKYVYNIEEVFIRMLRKEFGIVSRREEKKFTGVWVGNEKIAAIGIAVKQHVTMHGFAFNANTDLSHFAWINPCGLTGTGVTSLQKLLGKPVDFTAVNDLIINYFCRVFERKANDEGCKNVPR